MTCTFFGNRNTSYNIQPHLQEILEELIKNNMTDKFYVGNQGRFDSIVLKTLRYLKEIYPHIEYYVVLAYMPTEKENNYGYYTETIYPDGLETVPPRFAIDRRNRWMIDNSDMVIASVRQMHGGSAKYIKIAENKKKSVVNIPDFSKI